MGILLYTNGKSFPFRTFISLAFNRYGTENNIRNNPLIIVHGLFGQKKNWNSLAKTLQNRLENQVYTVDLRNHGDSPHSDEHTYFKMADDINAFINNVVFKDSSFESIFLMGHSMGGKVVSEYALRKEAKIKKLIVVDIAPQREISLQSNFPAFVRAMQSVNLKTSKRQINEQLALSIPDLSIRQFLMTNLIINDSENFVWKCNINAIDKNLDHILSYHIRSGIFSNPTLFLSGANSNYIKFKDRDELKRFFPNSYFISIDKAGHWVHSEKPKIFVEHVVKFIEN